MTLAAMYKSDYVQTLDQHSQTNLNSSWVNDKGTHRIPPFLLDSLSWQKSRSPLRCALLALFVLDTKSDKMPKLSFPPEYVSF